MKVIAVHRDKEFEVIETQTRTLVVRAKNEDDAIKKAKDLRYERAGMWVADCPEYIAEELDEEDG